MRKLNLVFLCLVGFFVNAQNRKNVIKLAPISIINNYLEIGFEYNYKELKTMEVTLGIIGLIKPKSTGNENESYLYKANGFFIKLNTKKVFSNFLSNQKSVYSGLYYSPEIAFAKFTETRNWTTNYNSQYFEEKSEYHIQALSLMFNFGAKLNIKNRILFDVYLGIGACFDNRNDAAKRYTANENNFIAKRYFETNRVATQLGFKIGYLF